MGTILPVENRPSSQTFLLGSENNGDEFQPFLRDENGFGETEEVVSICEGRSEEHTQLSRTLSRLDGFGITVRSHCSLSA